MCGNKKHQVLSVCIRHGIMVGLRALGIVLGQSSEGEAAKDN